MKTSYLKFLFSVDAKTISLLYFIYGLFTIIIGSTLSLMIRLELSIPGNHFIESVNYGNIYNLIITSHGLVMIFYAVMPLTLGGFGNYIVPIMIGAPDMSYPRLNNVSFWLMVPSLLLIYLSGFIESGAAAGWTVNGLAVFKILLDAGTSWKNNCAMIIEISLIYNIFIYITIINLIIYYYIDYKVIEEYLSYAKINYSARQSAWVIKLQNLIIHQRLNVENMKLKNNYNRVPNILFENLDKAYFWLVGFTDGDGCFNIYINEKNKKVSLTFKLDQSIYNIRILYKIKKLLGYGKIKKYKNMRSLVIRDKIVLENLIIPIFDKYPLLTSKHYDYMLFKEALNIWNNNLLTQTEKIDQLIIIKNKKISSDYISPALLNVTNGLNEINKYWLVGFIEAEGSFMIVKDKKTYSLEFGITQKKDPKLLFEIGKILKCKGKILYFNKANQCYNIKTRRKESIKFIINYFLNLMKGMKSLEFKIWSRTYYYTFLENEKRNLKMQHCKLILTKLRKKVK